MIFEVYFTRDELELLGRLRGTELDAVTSDGWALFMTTGVGVYQVTVVEVSTPDENHPAGDVTRPQIGIGEEPESPIETDFTAQAEVEDVTVLRTVVTMSEPERIEGGSNLHGVEMPPHIGYGPIYMHPEGEELDALKNRASVGNALSLAWLDIGFRLHFRDAEALSVHTDGAAFFPTLSRGQELDQFLPRRFRSFLSLGFYSCAERWMKHTLAPSGARIRVVVQECGWNAFVTRHKCVSFAPRCARECMDIRTLKWPDIAVLCSCLELVDNQLIRHKDRNSS